MKAGNCKAVIFGLEVPLTVGSRAHLGGSHLLSINTRKLTADKIIEPSAPPSFCLVGPGILF
jgi:hypothetical protein